MYIWPLRLLVQGSCGELSGFCGAGLGLLGWRFESASCLWVKEACCKEHSRDECRFFLLSSWKSKVPPSIPPPSQKKVQIGLNEALFGPCFGMGVA